MRPSVEVRRVSMGFAGVTVLREVNLELSPGQILAITGENGAGKSTLAKLIAGIYRPTAGEIRLFGEEVAFRGARDAADAGISLIHQEPQSFPDLTVAENICIGSQPRRAGLVDWRKMNRIAEEALAMLEARISTRKLVGELNVADRQLIEVAAALARNSRVLLFDETTASLTPKEVDELFAVMRRLRSDGRALAFVSHRLEEVFSLCDRVAVLRDGLKVFESDIGATSTFDVVRYMVGRDLQAVRRPAADSRRHDDVGVGGDLLKVVDMAVPRRVHGVSFSVRPGEIVALAGLVGSGRTEIAHGLFGVEHCSGSVALQGVRYQPRHPAEALARGVVLVPEDRQGLGLLLPMSIEENIVLPILRRLSRLWLGDNQKVARTWIDKLGIVCRDPAQPVGQLSGGNQQKVVVAKSLLTEPKLLIVDEPTRGVDVGAKAEIHQLLRELAGNGLGVLMISSDLPEVLSLADRILVMREGSLVEEISASDATAQSVMFAATGQEPIHA